MIRWLLSSLSSQTIHTTSQRNHRMSYEKLHLTTIAKTCMCAFKYVLELFTVCRHGAIFKKYAKVKSRGAPALQIFTVYAKYISSPFHWQTLSLQKVTCHINDTRIVFCPSGPCWLVFDNPLLSLSFFFYFPNGKHMVQGKSSCCHA